MPREHQSFGEQAAKFSLYAPFAALLIGVCTFGNRGQPGVAMAVAWINAAVVAAGLVLGIVALSSMRRFGRRRILVRAVVGVAINAVVILAVAMSLTSVGRATRARRMAVGHWRQAVNGRGVQQVDLTLDGNGTFVLEADRGREMPTATLIGTWVMTQDQVIGLTVDRVEGGDPAAVGKRIALGRVKAIGDDELVLSTDHGDEVYRHS